jgi:hypothetical protein
MNQDDFEKLQEFGVLDVGYEVLGVGYEVLGMRCWVLGMSSFHPTATLWEYRADGGDASIGYLAKLG